MAPGTERHRAKAIKVRRPGQGGQKAQDLKAARCPCREGYLKGVLKIFSKKNIAIVNLDIIDALKDDAVITPELLVERGVIKKMKDGLKVLASGSIQRPVTIKANAFSTSAAAKIEAAGGKTEVI